MTEDGLSGIVVGIGEKMSQLEVARFPSEDHRGPGLVVINDITRQYSLRYTMRHVYNFDHVCLSVCRGVATGWTGVDMSCLLYTSPSPRDS